MINLNTRYRVTQGQLGGRVLKPTKVSKCGTFGFFASPGFEHHPWADPIRISEKHLAPIGMQDVTQDLDTKAMGELRSAATAYVSTENLKRIESVKGALLAATEANVAEIEAIKAGVQQPGSSFDWVTVGLVTYGIAATIVTLVQ